MKNIELRQFKPADQNVVWQLHVKGVEQIGIYIRNPEYDADLDRIEDGYLKNGGDFLVATYNNNIVGMGGLRRVDGQTAEIKRMRTDQKYQNKGIGSLILDTLIRKAKTLGYKRIILDTVPQMRIAQHLYESRGFREYSRKIIGDFVLVLYELDLSQPVNKYIIRG